MQTAETTNIVDYRHVLLHAVHRGAAKARLHAEIYGVGSNEAIRAAVDTMALISEYRERFMPPRDAR